MSQLISRCGYRCDVCPAYVGNNKTIADQLSVAEGWSKYFGLKIPPETIRCNGCLSVYRGGYDFPDASCPIRSCVMENNMETCADCFGYPCDKLESRMSSVESAITQFKDKAPKKEFDTYVAPYDARGTLNELRDRRVDRID